MTHKPVSRSTQRRTGINPNLIVLGSVLLILILIGVMVAVTQDNGSHLVVVPESEWMPQGANFTPEFTLTGLESQEAVSLADYRGNYVLLNFWATWCPPCNKEMPDLQAYHTAHRDQNFTLLAVNVEEDAELVAAFMAAHDFDFPVVLDETGEIYARYGGNGLPSSFLIDPTGKIVKAWRPGAITPDMLTRDVTPLLQS